MSNYISAQPESSQPLNYTYQHGESRGRGRRSLQVALIVALALIGVTVFGPVNYQTTITSMSAERTDTSTETGTTIFGMPKSWQAASYTSDGASTTCTVTARGWWLIGWTSEHHSSQPGDTVSCTTWPFSG